MSTLRPTLIRSLTIAVVAALGLVPGAPAQAALRSYVENKPARGGNFVRVGIGVIHLPDGDYTKGEYDTILEPDKSTDDDPINWDEAYGYYIGRGFCAQVRSDNLNGLGWRREPDIVGPAAMWWRHHAYTQVTPYRC